MSTLDTKKDLFKKTILIYIIISIILFIFSTIYLRFSFGMNSLFMKYIALIPFFFGAFIFSIFFSFKNIKFSKLSFDLYNLAIYTFILGSLSQAILELSGRKSKYTIIFLILGGCLILISFINFIIKQLKKD